MEHYFDLSTKNETANIWTENFENSKKQGIIPDTIWPLSNDELYNYEKYEQLVMVGFRPYSEIIGNGRILKFFSCKLVQHQKTGLHKNFDARRCLRRRVFY